MAFAELDQSFIGFGQFAILGCSLLFQSDIATLEGVDYPIERTIRLGKL